MNFMSLAEIHNICTIFYKSFFIGKIILLRDFQPKIH